VEFLGEFEQGDLRGAMPGREALPTVR
jgi:hypothetical protein